MAAAAVKSAAAANARKKTRVVNEPAAIASWEASIKVNPAETEEEPEPTTGIWKYQAQTAKFYTDVRVEVFVAGLIAANFLTNIVEKQIWPSGSTEVPDGNYYQNVFSGMELFYNIAFTVELIINMYAFWLYKFWKSGWNIFDFVVVTIGLLDTANAPLPGPLSMLRMMRAFRVFRLFKRVKSLNKIIVSLAKAVPGVMNAFFIMLLVMCIYAILAVDLFRDVGKDGIITFESTYHGLPDDDGSTLYFTSRGGWFGHEYFGNFMKSLYTLFQVLTGESWSEAVARPLLEGWSPAGAGIFFVSFILLNAVVLINVVVAVLLEKMVDDEPEELAAPIPNMPSSEIELAASSHNPAGQGESSEKDAQPDGAGGEASLKPHGVEAQGRMEAEISAMRMEMLEMKAHIAKLVALLGAEGTERKAVGFAKETRSAADEPDAAPGALASVQGGEI